MSSERILVVEDQEATREFISMILSDAGYRVDTAASGGEAIHRLESEIYDLVLTDLKLGDLSGTQVLQKAMTLNDPPVVIILTAFGTVENAVEAMKIGAYDYLTKPVSSDQLLHSINRGLERRRLARRVQELESRLLREEELKNLVAKSGAMRLVLETVRQVANSDVSVLIEGESGVGKEVVARAIHALSKRRDHSFVAVNCGAMPETLLESELFGYVKGAFTGAIETKKGLFEEAHGGTLFLDEIGETSPAFQVKLLRALQDGEIRRVGDNKPIHVDVRVLAASNRDMKDLVEKGKFRQDLYYRLNVITLRIPPLRERREDILPLAEHFLRIAARKAGRAELSLHPRTIRQLESYHWPGNVRELQNAIERAVVLARSKEIMPEDLPSELSGGEGEEFPEPEKEPVSMKEMEKAHILKILKKTNWNQSEAARLLGIGYNTLWRKMKEFGIKRPS